MLFVCLALIGLNIAQYVLSTRREQRLIDALMARNAGEYALIRRADSKPAPKGAKQPDSEPATGWMVGA